MDTQSQPTRSSFSVTLIMEGVTQEELEKQRKELDNYLNALTCAGYIHSILDEQKKRRGPESREDEIVRPSRIFCSVAAASSAAEQCSSAEQSILIDSDSESSTSETSELKNPFEEEHQTSGGCKLIFSKPQQSFNQAKSSQTATASGSHLSSNLSHHSETLPATPIGLLIQSPSTAFEQSIIRSQISQYSYPLSSPEYSLSTSNYASSPRNSSSSSNYFLTSPNNSSTLKYVSPSFKYNPSPSIAQPLSSCYPVLPTYLLSQSSYLPPRYLSTSFNHIPQSHNYSATSLSNPPNVQPPPAHYTPVTISHYPPNNRMYHSPGSNNNFYQSYPHQNFPSWR